MIYNSSFVSYLYLTADSTGVGIIAARLTGRCGGYGRKIASYTTAVFPLDAVTYRADTVEQAVYSSTVIYPLTKAVLVVVSYKLAVNKVGYPLFLGTLVAKLFLI